MQTTLDRIHAVAINPDPAPASIPGPASDPTPAPEPIPQPSALPTPQLPIVVPQPAAIAAANVYQQTTGRFTGPTGTILAIGYSGNGPGLNNPALQTLPMHGPIPQGEYQIGPAHTHPILGPLAMALTPSAGQQLFGRSGFFIHGDNDAMDHTASDGCIILPREARAAIAAAANRTLRVTA